MVPLPVRYLLVIYGWAAEADSSCVIPADA